MTQKFFQWLTLIIGTLIFLGIILLAIIIYKNINIIQSDPCKLCIEGGFSCFKVRGP